MKTPLPLRFALNHPGRFHSIAVLATALALTGCQKAESGTEKEKADPAITSSNAPVADSTTVLASTNVVTSTTDPAPAAAPVPPVNTSQFQWPRTYKDGNTTLLVYQPEIEQWDGYNFRCRFAVSIQDAGAPAPTFGVVWLSANSEVDKDEGVVTLTNLKITKANFPTEPNNAEKYTTFLSSQLPPKPLAIPLAQIDNKYLLGQALKKVATQPVKNTPPRIIFSDEPAVLIPVNGDPVMRALGSTGYNRVLNTNALIVQNADSNGSGPFYLSALGYWYKSDAIQGPWSVDADAGTRLAPVYDAAAATKQIDLLPPAQGKNPPAPDIYVSTVPAELIQSDGQPMFVPIHHTQLLEVRNSDNAIILDVSTQLFYALISGRWFSSPALTGQPWSFVPGGKLPADFAKIPPNSDKGNVLVSVPGTPQAEEAVIANSIPQTATVNRQEAKLTVAYDNDAPQFSPITGTTLQYALNTTTPVIEVSAHSFYAVANGVWFTAPAPVGPWVVATSVPPVIYGIPVSSPVHYVTYVQVYGYTDSVVYVGYTPGYYGTVVTPDGVVVYGTGYAYPPYIGTTVYVAPPPTYGYGAGFSDGAASGFLFGFAAGAVVGACLSPDWGCWGGNTYNVNVNNGNIYNNWGNHVVTNHPYYGYHGGGYGGAGYNPYNGNWAAAHNGGVYNPATGSYAAGRSGAVGNAYTGNYAAGRQGTAYNPNTGRSVSGESSISGNAYNGNWNANQNRSFDNNRTGVSGSSSKTASGNAYNGTYNSTTDRSVTTANGSSISSSVTKGSGEPTTREGTYTNGATGQTKSWDHTSGEGTQASTSPSPDRVYSGSDGNVYRPNANGNGYQQATANGWQDAAHNSSQSQDLDRQAQGWGDSSRWGSDGSGSDRWGGGGFGGGDDRWGGGGFGGGDGGSRWGGDGGGDRFGGNGGGRWGGGGRSWR